MRAPTIAIVRTRDSRLRSSCTPRLVSPLMEWPSPLWRSLLWGAGLVMVIAFETLIFYVENAEK